MVSKLCRRVRCDDVLKLFMSQSEHNSFMTLTTPDVVTLDTIRLRWRSLRHYLVEREGPDFKYVMNYELHPGGHGWHIHAVFNRYINLRGDGLYKLRRYGFKMINVKPVSSLGLSLYLSKHCLKAYRGVAAVLKGKGSRLRLVNTSRGLPRLSDYHWCSSYLQQVRELVNSKYFRAVFTRENFYRRYQYAECCTLLGISPDALKARLSALRLNHLRLRQNIKCGGHQADLHLP